MSTVQPFVLEAERRATDGTLRKRAYQLARSGACKSLAEIARRLKSEGYPTADVEAALAQEPVNGDLERILSAANDT
jgi:hypothetical protein